MTTRLPMSEDETQVGWFTEWYRQTPTAIQFWEGLVTDKRVIWCRVGESFKSLLLRADMGARKRETVAELSPDELEEFNAPTFVMPLQSLRSIHLQQGGFMRRSRLTIEGEVTKTDGFESLTLYNTSEGDTQVDFVKELAADNHLSHVTISVDTPRFSLS